VRILHRHLVEKVALSDLCDEYGLNPTVFYRWQKTFFDRGAAAFDNHGDTRSQKLEKKVSGLQAKLSQKDEVIAEIMAPHVALNKYWGGLSKSWVSHDVRDEVIHFHSVLVGDDRACGHALGVTAMDRDPAEQTLPVTDPLWETQKASGRGREIPRDFWLEAWEEEAIVNFSGGHPRKKENV
jgi:transposase-like protein